MGESVALTRRDKFSSIMELIFGEKTFCLYIVLCMISVPLTEMISEFNGIQLRWEEVTFTFCGLIGVFLCTGKIALNPTGKHWTDFFYFTLHIFMFVSLVYSANIARILRPNAPTNEYPSYFLGYYAMMYAGAQLSSKKLRKIVLGTFIGLAAFEGVVGILQTFNIKIMPVMWKGISNQSYGFTQNTNLYGALCVLFVGACAGLFIFTKNAKLRVISGIVFFIAMYNSVTTASRLSWLGDCAVAAFLLVSILIMMIRNKDDRKTYKKMLIWFAVLLVIAAGAAVCGVMNSSFIVEKFEQTGTEIAAATSEGGNAGSVGSGRMTIWTFALKAFPRHWVTGVGLDNLYQCYIENRQWVNGMYYSNQAHNEYLQVLVTQGVFAFINYMAVLIIAGVKGVKRVLKNDDNEDRILTWIFLAMFAGYCVSQFFQFRSFTVEPYFFLLIGLVCPRVHKKAAAKA
ncbi:MAG: O-antigen ligase family protein [Clostridiales bacterium]|nr:O-antigen ligase family protein [Clostridiales bacterium]